jgi:hypothetical protein
VRFASRDKGCAARIGHETGRVFLVVPKVAATRSLRIINELRCGLNPSLPPEK